MWIGLNLPGPFNVGWRVGGRRRAAAPADLRTRGVPGPGYPWWAKLALWLLAGYVFLWPLVWALVRMAA
jgi:hypothetical protein